MVQNSFDQKGLPLPTKKKRPYSVYYISDIKKRALFFNFCTKMHPSHVALPLMSAFFSMACKIILYKSCGELFSFTPGLGSCRVYWCGFLGGFKFTCFDQNKLKTHIERWVAEKRWLTARLINNDF